MYCCLLVDLREIKHHVYGRREGQKYHVIMSFRHFLRLLFALALANNASMNLKFFNLSATIISLCLSPVMFYLIFYIS